MPNSSQRRAVRVMPRQRRAELETVKRNRGMGETEGMKVRDGERRIMEGGSKN